jgi:hypothetical protein
MRSVRAEIAALVALVGTSVSAFALAQGGAQTPALVPDASAPDAAPAATPPSEPDAGPALEDAAPPEVAPVEADAGADVAAPVPLAQPPPEMKPNGFGLALRAGYAIPYGNAKDVSLSAAVPGAIHIGVDLGYFIDPHFYVGGYFTYGFSIGDSTAGTACGDPEASCSATPIRLGLGARWHFLPSEILDPWAGLAFGYEIVNLTDSNSGQSEALHGFEGILEAGLDYKPKPFYGIGPFLQSSLGHYAGSSSFGHGWLDMGLRVRTRL